MQTLGNAGPRVVTRWSWFYSALLMLAFAIGLGAALGFFIVLFLWHRKDAEDLDTLDQCRSQYDSVRNAWAATTVCLVAAQASLFAIQVFYRLRMHALADEASQIERGARADSPPA